MAHKGQLGASTTLVETKQRRQRRERRKRREEQTWASKCGPVTVRRVDPAEIELALKR